MTRNKSKIKITSVIALVTLTLLFSISNSFAAITSSYVSYQVQPGDFLWLIGWKFEVSANSIMLANNLKTTTIYSGQILKIPSSTGFVREIPTSVKYIVKKGDTLYLIGQKFGVASAKIMEANKLNGTAINVSQELSVPLPPQKRYTVQSGDTLYLVAKKFGANVEGLQIVNKMNSVTLWVRQVLFVPDWGTATSQPTATNPTTTPVTTTTTTPVTDTSTTPTTGTTTTTPVPDTTTTPTTGNTTTPVTEPTQTPVTEPTQTPVTDTTDTSNNNTQPSADNTQSGGSSVSGTVSVPSLIPDLSQIDLSKPLPAIGQWGNIPQGVVLYHVVQGDTIWSVSQKYHTTMDAIIKTNHLHGEYLQINQTLFVPENSTQPATIQNPTGSQKDGFGELMDWEYASWIFDTDNMATITDLLTGKSFNIKRYGGSNHSDSEPLTAADTATMKDIYGGQWSWTPRAVLVTVGDKVLAASMAGMPHSYDSIPDNDFAGHFDLYFLNSRTHYDNTLVEGHQRMVLKAAGY